MTRIAKLVNGFNFIEGNFIEDLESDNEQGVGLHIVDADIEAYDEDGVYFKAEQNTKAYIKNSDGSKEYFEIERMKNEDYSKFFNKGNDCDLCKNQYLTGQYGDALGCRCIDNKEKCNYEERMNKTFKEFKEEVGNAGFYVYDWETKKSLYGDCDNKIVVDYLYSSLDGIYTVYLKNKNIEF
jgi:hypothetical protein